MYGVHLLHFARTPITRPRGAKIDLTVFTILKPIPPRRPVAVSVWTTARFWRRVPSQALPRCHQPVLGTHLKLVSRTLHSNAPKRAPHWSIQQYFLHRPPSLRRRTRSQILVWVNHLSDKIITPTRRGKRPRRSPRPISTSKHAEAIASGNSESGVDSAARAILIGRLVTTEATRGIPEELSCANGSPQNAGTHASDNYSFQTSASRWLNSQNT